MKSIASHLLLCALLSLFAANAIAEDASFGNGHSNVILFDGSGKQADHLIQGEPEISLEQIEQIDSPSTAHPMPKIMIDVGGPRSETRQNKRAEINNGNNITIITGDQGQGRVTVSTDQMHAPSLSIELNNVGAGFEEAEQTEEFQGQSFIGQRLEGIDFSGKSLKNANFSMTDLTGANFSGADLSGASFSMSNLNLADLSKTNLDGATFDSANLTGANVRCASLNNTTFIVSNLEGADLSGSDLDNVTFQLSDTQGMTTGPRDCSQ